MTALSDIRREVATTLSAVAIEAGQPVSPAGLRFIRHEKLRIDVGHAAAQAICAEMQTSYLPPEIDDVPVRLAKGFPGFELVIL
jgi:hypothetical protein